MESHEIIIRICSVMKVLYISYWGLNDGLTQSSVLPHIRILSQMHEVSKIYFVTIERGAERMGSPELGPQVVHMVLRSKRLPVNFLEKVNDFWFFPRTLKAWISRYSIDLMVCRSSPAGALGAIINRRTGIPFIVESFEPHAEYMLDAKVWSRWGLKYFFQSRWEQRIVQKATGIITVSRHYKDKLKLDRSASIETFPCAVNVGQFEFDMGLRKAIRSKLGFENKLVGIYVGKFGDIYYDQTAFFIFKRAYDLLGEEFRLIVLSPVEKSIVLHALKKENFPIEKVFVDKVPHQEVPAYLSAADFAFSMVRPAPVRLYCSPIKDGEYWANGLPILSPEGVGEDSEIIVSENAGAVFREDLGDLDEAILKIKMLSAGDRKGHIRSVAAKYRSFDPLVGIYRGVFKEIQKSSLLESI